MEGDQSANSSFGDEPLDVKPLRCFAPMFPAPFAYRTFSPSEAPPSFVCVTPFGPHPPGFTPFIPSDSQPPSEHTPQSNIRRDNATIHGHSSTKNDNRRTTSRANNQSSTVSDEVEDSFGKTQKRRLKRARNVMVVAPLGDGDRESVVKILMTFDAMRRRLLQIEEVKEASSVAKRPDLKAGALMMTRGLKAHANRRIGAVPGVEIGDLFYFRFEMCLVGLHAPSMAGIDYMNVKFDRAEEPVALSIVSSGMYDDDDNDADVLIYSGQGGTKVGKQIDDQKLERGNLALENSSQRKNEIRVIRGMKDSMSSISTNRIYVYDGLYKIDHSWIEKNKSGFSIFKYKLLRVPGQPDGSLTWKYTKQWKENPRSRSHLILPDISSGAENMPVCLVNDVDGEKGPTHFSYITSVKYMKPISSSMPDVGCRCQSVCMPSDGNCSCGPINGGYLPYSSNGLLARRRALIIECGPSCNCSPNCRNRLSQKGIRFRFEVFKTRDRGWGLRSWDPIRAGSFLCEYIGEVIDRIVDDDEDDMNDFTFRAALSDECPFQPSNIYELIGEDQPVDWNETPKSLSFTLNAKNMGNLSRFMNHSCTPNVFWQPVLYDHRDDCYPHIMFYAMKHIPPMTELTYDYGQCGNQSHEEEMPSSNEHHRRKKCLCGSEKCRGFFS